MPTVRLTQHHRFICFSITAHTPMNRISLLLLLSAQVGLAATNPYVAQAKVHYQRLEYEQCLKRLNSASLLKGIEQGDLAQIELYEGLCKLGLGQMSDAQANFDLALQLDPAIALPPLQSPRIVELFRKAQAKLPQPEPVVPVAPQPEPTLTAEPLTARLTEPTQPPPAVVDVPTAVAIPAPVRRSFVPTAVFTTLAAVAVGLAVVFGLTARSTAVLANEAPFQSDALVYGGQARTLATASTVSWVTAGLSALTASVLAVVALVAPAH
jgi:hypothetical protein